MAKNLVQEQRNLENEIRRLTKTVRELKIQAESGTRSQTEHQKALQQYNLYKKQLETKKSDLVKTNAQLVLQQIESKKESGAANVKKVETRYAELNKQLSYQLDPNSKTAKDIQAKIDALAGDYQSALSDAGGMPVSLVYARSKLKKIAVPTFGGKSNVKGLSGPSGATGLTGPTGSKVTVTGPTGPTGPKVGASGISGSSGASGVSGVSGISGPTGPTGTKVPSSLDTLLQKTEFWYDLPDYIFKLEPALGKLLVEAVDGQWGNDKFLAAAQLTPWWQKNAPTIRTRIVDQAKYNELKAAGQDVSKTEYALYLGKQMNAVKAKALEIAGVTLTDEQAQSVATKIYNGFLDDDPVAISALIVPFIGKVTSIVGTGTGMKSVTTFSGQALQSYQTLQAIAKANGFTIKDILPNISTSLTGGDLETAILQKLALGEIDINRVAQDARALAAQGQPQYVRNLLNQGYDLENVYAPYKQQMAAVLEVNPDQIDLNDPTLRSAITDKGDMNMYDFKRSLRQDNRWQYTQSAKTEVSDTALRVLKDFGFQG